MKELQKFVKEIEKVNTESEKAYKITRSYFEDIERIKSKLRQENITETEKGNLIKEYEKRDVTQKEANKKETFYTMQKNVLYNNIQKIIMDLFINEILENIINKYFEKSIGEKTKEKIENEISNELSEKTGIFINCHFSKTDNYNFNDQLYETTFTIDLLPYKNYEIIKNYYGKETKSGINKFFESYSNTPTITINKLYNPYFENKYTNKDEFIQTHNIIKNTNEYIISYYSNCINWEIQENTKEYTKK